MRRLVSAGYVVYCDTSGYNSDISSQYQKKSDGNESVEGTSESSERQYVPNDGKHKETSNGYISADPFWNDQTAGQESLSSAYSSSTTKQLYDVYEDKLVKFQPENAGDWHAYEVINPAVEVPTDVLRAMKNDGLITNSQYHKWIKNK